VTRSATGRGAWLERLLGNRRAGESKLARNQPGLNGPETILAERSSIRLSADAASAFTEALERPAQVNGRLAKALRRKRKFSWLD
jgi:hypothetical protein